MILKLAHSFAEEAAMVDDHGSTPLHIACWDNNHHHHPHSLVLPLEVLQALLVQACPQAATDQDVVGNTPLHVATSHPDTRPEIVRALLEACPIASSIKNKEGLLPLHMACRYAPKNELVIAVLVDAYPLALRSRTKVRQNQGLDDLLRSFVVIMMDYDYYSSESIISMVLLCLLALFCFFNKMGELAPAAKKRHSVDAKNNNHFVTDLAGKSNLRSSYGGDLLDLQIRDGSYPLHMAIEAGCSRNVVELLMLVRGGEDTPTSTDLLLLTNKHGETPLHVALANPSSSGANGDELVDWLLTEQTSNRCGELTTRMREKRHGNLPIHAAATHGCSVVLAKKLLLWHPNSIHEKNNEDKTPLDLAVECGRCSEKVLRLFESRDPSEATITNE
jgi:ankyrin repeat protein